MLKLDSLTKKIIFSLIGLSIVLMVAIGLIASHGLKMVIQAYAHNQAGSYAELLTKSSGLGQANMWLESGEKNRDYEVLQQKVDGIAEVSYATRLGVYEIRDDSLVVIYEKKADEKDVSQMGASIPINKTDRKLIDECLEDNGETSESYYASKYSSEGKSYTIPYASFCTGVSVSEDRPIVVIMEQPMMLNSLIHAIVIAEMGTVILLVMVLAMVFFYRRTRRNIIKPITDLQEATSDLVENLTETEGYVSHIYTGDEIETLSHSFETMDAKLRTYLKENEAITAERSRLATELGISSRIQEGMLPHEFPAFPERKEFDIYASMIPAREVGGDFYDFYLKDDDHLVLVLGDVSGKGISAALFMSATMIMLRDYAKSSDALPHEILSRVNDSLSDINEAEFFVTVWMGILTISTGEIVYVNAGHEYPAIYRKGEAFTIEKDSHGIPLAAMEGFTYKGGTMQLSPGDALYIYSDGVTEANDLENQQFGEERLLQALNHHPDGTPEEIDTCVHEHIEEFIGDADQFDDTTMLCLRYN